MAKAKASAKFVSHGDDPMLSYTEAGEMVGRSNTTIRRWVEDGLLRKVEDPSGVPRIRQSELAKFYGASALAEVDAERKERDERQRQELLEKMRANEARDQAISERDSKMHEERFGLPESVEATLVEEEEDGEA